METPLLPVLPGYDNPQLIAHGTTALVFRATQTNLNRLVAIKVITVDTGSVPVNAARELATTVALSSQPHIVSIIDTGMTTDDRPYIVMEYCEGGSYAQILRRGGPLAVADVLEVGVKIGEALHAAHQAGIVHRDVKPSNILRSRFGPALTDFGIARAPDELGSTLTREMMTPHHASPEALLHQAQSGPSDVYSLASTLWTLLTGHPPFVDPKRPAVDMYMFRDRVLHDPVPTMERDDVPAWLHTELRRAMSKLPSERHASAAAFAEALRRGALGLAPEEPAAPTPVVSRPVIPVDSPWGTPFTPSPPPIGRASVPTPTAGPGNVPPWLAAAPAPPAPAPPAPAPPAPAPPAPAPPAAVPPAAARPTPAPPAPASSTPGSPTPVSSAPVSSAPVFPAPMSPAPVSPAPAGAAPAPISPATGSAGPLVGADAQPPPPASPAIPAEIATDGPPTGRGRKSRRGRTPNVAAQSQPVPEDLPGWTPLSLDPADVERHGSAGLSESPAAPALSIPGSPPAPAVFGPADQPAAQAPPVPVAQVEAPTLPPHDAPASPTTLPPDSGPAEFLAAPPHQPPTTRPPTTHPPTARQPTVQPLRPSQPQPHPGQPYPDQHHPGQPYPDQPYLGQQYHHQPSEAFPAGQVGPVSPVSPVSLDSGPPPWATTAPPVSAPPAHPTRRFSESEPEPRSGARTGIVVGLVIATLVAVAAGAVITLLANRSTGSPNARPPAASTQATPSATVRPSATNGGPPRDVKLTDRGSSISISWTDPSGGAASFVVVGTDPGGHPLTAQSVPKEQTTVTFNGLTGTGRYCFRVGAVYAYDNVVSTDPVCTTR